MQKVRDFIASGYLERRVTNPPDLAESSQHVGLARYYFSRLFTQLKGISHDDYMRILRIEQAKRWLVEGKSIKDVASDLGFLGSDHNDLSHFYEVFKKHSSGVTLGAYRDTQR